ncbi:GNAT family N-acyltransferase [Leptodesmis sichuanensis]|uniref:GNAT family N-acyltransferase n=1 Tax=Leptodesmis sichuanensis TaxID=2906798 RepID=UPI001F230FB7|nr:GNAT family N-acyltransferase [Leptodesmis sichuanensis]UIE39638.1 GNAT family N-acetyltransferase [Leptodesmis sichuanensis A121]
MDNSLTHLLNLAPATMIKQQLVAQQNSSRFYSRPLQIEQHIKLAQRLVHQVFVEEMGWIPDPLNPSGIRCVDDRLGKLFVDDFDEAAIWFGTFHHGHLIACWRFCPPRNGKFELEHYHPIPDFLKTSASLEVTRLVIYPQYRQRSRVLLNLAQTTHQHLRDQFNYVFAAVEFPHPGNLYLKLGLKRAGVSPFKYSPVDQNEVEIVVLDLQDRTTLASQSGC